MSLKLRKSISKNRKPRSASQIVASIHIPTKELRDSHFNKCGLLSILYCTKLAPSPVRGWDLYIRVHRHILPQCYARSEGEVKKFNLIKFLFLTCGKFPRFSETGFLWFYPFNRLFFFLIFPLGGEKGFIIRAKQAPGVWKAYQKETHPLKYQFLPRGRGGKLHPQFRLIIFLGTNEGGKKKYGASRGGNHSSGPKKGGGGDPNPIWGEFPWGAARRPPAAGEKKNTFFIPPSLRIGCRYGDQIKHEILIKAPDLKKSCAFLRVF